MANLLMVQEDDFVRIGDKVYYVQDSSWENRTVYAVPAEDISLSDNEITLKSKARPFSGDTVELIKPVRVPVDTVRSLFRLETTPWELALNHQYPFSPLIAPVEMREKELLHFIDNIQTTDNVVLLNAWMDLFYYQDEVCFSYVRKPDKPGFTLSYLWNQMGQAIDWFDTLEDARESLADLKKCYVRSKNKPLVKTVIPKCSEMNMIEELENFAKSHPVTDEMREYYEQLLDTLLKRWDTDGITHCAYAYYGGNRIVECNWKKSEEALLMLFAADEDPPTGDPYAANSLGYIYYSDRLGTPNYDKAFRCFSYAAESGVVEATYKLSDMYRKGHGTERDPDKAWDLLNGLYQQAEQDRAIKRKLPDIALRVGYCYRDGIGVSPDLKKAQEFFLIAEMGIKKRLRDHPGYGDETVRSNIQKSIDDINKRLKES